MRDFHHIHFRAGEDWVCGRSVALDESEVFHWEARDPDEDEACRCCAEQILNYFGAPMHVH